VRESLCARAITPEEDHSMGYFTELNDAIASLKRLLSSEGSRLVHDERLCKAMRKLETIQKGGKVVRKEDLVAVTKVICEVLCEELL
jgi:hypothetical protein